MRMNTETPRPRTAWERLEEYLFDHDKDGTDFSVEEYAKAIDLDTEQASRDIQSYLDAQRRDNSKTLYVLHRRAGTRTTSARWLVGMRTRDARQLGAALHDDVAARVRRAFVPDLRRIAQINPRAAKVADAQITRVVNNAMEILEMAVRGTLIP